MSAASDTAARDRPSSSYRRLTAVADRSLFQVLRELDSGPRGLTEQQAAVRLAEHGENVVAPGPRPTWARRLRTALREPFTLVLLVLALVSAAIGAHSTTVVIAVLVGASIVLRLVGEHRADRAAAGLQGLVAATATVLRRADDAAAPQAREVPLEQLVPGDVVVLAAGDVIPADLRLIRADGLTVGQAALTGESAAVAKEPDGAAAAPGAAGAGSGALFDVARLCFLGSSVATGSGTAVVVATGVHTYLGAARRGAAGPAPEGTAFDRSARAVSLTLVRLMAATVPLVLAGNWLISRRGWEALPFAVAVAVGLTPEMLPVAVMTALSRGAAALRRRRVIVKRLPALHDLGTMDVLCADKTGTLTRDRLTVGMADDGAGGPAPEALAWAAVNSTVCAELADPPTLDAFDEALFACLDAEPSPPGGDDAAGGPAGDAAAEPGGAALGDPAALLDDPRAADLLAEAPFGLRAVPYDPSRRRATVVVRRASRPGRQTVVVKGAVEEVLSRCTRIHAGAAGTGADGAGAGGAATTGPGGAGPGGAGAGRGRPSGALPACGPALADVAAARTPHGPAGSAAAPEAAELDDAARARVEELAARYAAGGRRLLAVAVKERPGRAGRPGDELRPSDERGMVLLGLVAFRDEPDPTAPAALADLAAKGVSVRVVTGDHPFTAARACQDVGIAPGRVVTGERIDTLGDAALTALASRTTVFARTTPRHKARIVRALRTGGHTVGFLGDGVNDIPALRAADVGICPHGAMDAARECADVVLADKDLAAVDRAVRAGRRSLGNIGRYLRITLSANVGNVLAMLAAGVLLPFLPMLPSQVLVQNLCFDAAQLALAFDRGDGARPLRGAALARYTLRFGAFNAAADLATFGVLWWLTGGFAAPHAEAVFHAGWFTENLLSQALTVQLLRGPARAPLVPRLRAALRRGRTRAPRATRAGSGRFGPRAVLRRVRGGDAGPTAVTAANAALVAAGLVLPWAPFAAGGLGMQPPPAAYYPLLAVVLAAYGAVLVAVRRRWSL